MNIIMNDKGEFIEIQGTGEEATFTQDDLMKFIEVSKNAFDKLFKLQMEIAMNREKMDIYSLTIYYLYDNIYMYLK